MKAFLKITFAIFLTTISFSSFAQRTASVNGNWNSTATWGGASVPTSTDQVTINTGITVTVNVTNAACASMQINSGGNNTAVLAFASSGSPKLTVSGNVTVGQSGNSNREGTITFQSGSTLECGSLSLGAVASQTSALTMTAGGYLKVNGALTVFSGSTFTRGTGTVELAVTNTLPTSIFTSFNNLIISGGTTTTGTSISCSTLVVNASTQLNVASGHTLTINNGTGTDLTVNGTLSNAGTITQSASTTAAFNSGSTYIHAVNGGTIPTATWANSSTCSITGLTNIDVSGLASQEFGNFTYNCGSQSDNIDFDQSFIVKETFSIISTNNQELRLTNTSAARSITTKNFTMTGGLFFLSDDSGIGTLNVSGNFSHTAGTISEGSTGSGSIIFNGTTTQTFTSGGTVSNTINYTINNNAILQMAAEATVVNGASFTLSSGGTLDIKSANGITTSGASGNIRTTTRTYNTAANYIYSGTAQTVGNGLTGARNLTLSGSGNKTFANANFTAVTNTSLPVTVDLNIGSGVVLAIPTAKIIEVSSKLYIAGVGKINGSYGSTTSNATYTDNTYFTATTGKVNSTLSALPVTLTSFTAKPTPDNKVSLAWVTSTEQVNKGFRIERQAGNENGKFEQIGFVGSKAKDGNSQSMLTYNFIDAAPKVGVASFYRLVQEDLDGKLTYTEVRVVKLNGQSVSMVFPNPSNGAVNISRTADGKKMNIQVIDQSGRIISQVNNVTDANYRMNISHSGVYTIKMTYPETGEQSLQRIVVQK